MGAECSFLFALFMIYLFYDILFIIYSYFLLSARPPMPFALPAWARAGGRARKKGGQKAPAPLDFSQRMD